MAYSNHLLDNQGPLRPADIFAQRWRVWPPLRVILTSLEAIIVWLSLVVLWKSKGLQLFVALNNRAPALSWRVYLQFATQDTFEQDFCHAWHEHLSLIGNVIQVRIFVGKETMSVPILFDHNDLKIGNDAKTFEQLRMWYDWMLYKRGFGEVILPRQLTRIDKVWVCHSTGNPVLGSHIKTYGLGRSGTSMVVNFLDPSRLPQHQRFQTTDMVTDADTCGLEFVRTWDRSKLSMISLIPFGLSLLFAIIWIAASVARYKVDTQVAIQTAFTVAGYIVTAGALLIALFAFLDDQSR